MRDLATHVTFSREDRSATGRVIRKTAKRFELDVDGMTYIFEHVNGGWKLKGEFGQWFRD
jgi:hypothetical protein